jgi:hypothetical protein
MLCIQTAMDLQGMLSIEEALQRAHRAWVVVALARAEHVRESKWTESVAFGSRSFVKTIKGKLGVKAPSGLRVAS